MKKLIIAVLLIALVVGGVFAQQRFRRGTYTATAQGYEGPITVSVTVNASRITAIVVDSHGDTGAFANMVFQTLIPAMIEAQSTDVDVLSGATGTSTGLKAAVQDAIDQARR